MRIYYNNSNTIVIVFTTEELITVLKMQFVKVK